MISVVVPVGPHAHHQAWLKQCAESVLGQFRDRNDELLLIDDMAAINPAAFDDKHITIWRSPWLIGCATGWNIGINLAKNDLCLMMASDDWLEPECLYNLMMAWNRYTDPLGYYHLTIRYVAEVGAKFDWPPIQDLPCNAAMVHKALWRHTGGFPPCAGLGAPDALFISVLLYHGAKAGNLIPVAKGTPLYNVRVHPHQETSANGSYWNDIISVRDKYTLNWRPASWHRTLP